MKGGFDLKKFQERFFYITVFITGATVLIIEILGTRILAPFYGSTIFVWSALISVALGFLSLGYWLGGKMADKWHSTKEFFLIIIATGFVFWASIQYKKYIILFADQFGLQYGPLVATTLLYGATFILLGMVGPYAIRLVTTSAEHSGSSSGSIFTFSTIGSLVGALLAGFVLVPILSTNIIFSGLSVLLVTLGVVGLVLSNNFSSLFDDKRRTKITNTLLGLIIFSLAIGVVGYFVTKVDTPKLSLASHGVFGATEIIYQDHSFYGTYEVIGLPRVLDGILCFLIDGTNQGCVNPRSEEQDTGSRYSLAHVFIKELPADSDVLVLGSGAGEYFRNWARDDINYDIVDINPNAAEVLAVTGVQLDPKRQTLFTTDARVFLRENEKQYDIIWNDLLGNASPVTHMMSKEAYELMHSRIKDGGLMLNAVIGKTNGEDQLVNNTVVTMQEVFSQVFITPENDDRFFSYVLLPATKNERFGVESFNEEFRESWNEEDWGEPEYRFSDPDFEGEVITDSNNYFEYIWAKNARDNESVASFRMKFKRLTAEYFE